MLQDYTYFYYPTVLVIVQKAFETSTNIPRYCTVGFTPKHLIRYIYFTRLSRGQQITHASQIRVSISSI